MYSLWASSIAGSISQMRHTIYTLRAKKPISHGDPKWNAKTEHHFQWPLQILVDQETKNLQQTFSQICPGKGKGCHLTPKTEQHTEHDSVTLAKDATRRKGHGHFRQESTSVTGRAGRSRDSGQVAIWKLSWTTDGGLKRGHVHWLQWEQVCLSAYLGCALVVRGVEKQERPGGRLKAEIRLLVSLPTAKPLDGSLTSCQEPHTARGEEGGT